MNREEIFVVWIVMQDLDFEEPIHFVCTSLVRINRTIRLLQYIRKQIRLFKIVALESFVRIHLTERDRAMKTYRAKR